MGAEWLKEMELGSGRWTVLLQSPDSSWWVTLESGVVQAPPFDDEACDVGLPSGEPFEASAFDGEGIEKRWVRGQGSATISHEDHAQGCNRCIESQLLLWGRAEMSTQGWTVMAEPRIGRYPIPVEVKPGARVVLKLHEVLTKGPHGNCSTGPTVHLGFEAFRGEQA